MATEVLATHARGNTKARAYCLTLNEVDREQELIDGMKSYKTLRYIMIGALEHAPTTGHEHKHVFVYFNAPIKLNIKKCAGCHVEIAMGSFKDNLAYLTKEGELTYEYGERPHQGAKTVKELKETDIEDIPPQYYNIKERIDRKATEEQQFFEMLNEIKNDELKAPKVVYITGGTGKGKTYTAYKRALQTYDTTEIGKLTLKNDFIDVVNESAKCFVIEEFRPSEIKAADFLQLTDKYGYRANVKGGFVSLRPETLFICSIKRPEEIYKEEVNKQFIRRITEIIDLDIDPDMNV